MFNIVYRPCPLETNGETNKPYGFRPEWFSKCGCYKSLLMAMINAKDHINMFTIIYDGIEGEFSAYIKSSFPILDAIGMPYEYIIINKGTVLGSLTYGTEYGILQGKDTYFVEDDYLHTPESILKMHFALPKLQLLSGYSHPNSYTISQDNSEYDLKILYDSVSDMHWRTVEYTSHSYMITAALLDTLQDDLMRHESLASDIALWKHLHTKNIPIWVPIPGLTTQVDPYLSLGTNWSSLMLKIYNYNLGF